MKTSESSTQENNSPSGSKFNKELKQVRLDYFEEELKENLISNDCIIAPFDGSKIVIDTQSNKYGILDFFPKANKVLIRKENYWKEAGLKWIKDNLIK